MGLKAQPHTQHRCVQQKWHKLLPQAGGACGPSRSTTTLEEALLVKALTGVRLSVEEEEETWEKDRAASLMAQERCRAGFLTPLVPSSLSQEISIKQHQDGEVQLVRKVNPNPSLEPKHRSQRVALLRSACRHPSKTPPSFPSPLLDWKQWQTRKRLSVQLCASRCIQEKMLTLLAAIPFLPGFIHISFRQELVQGLKFPSTAETPQKICCDHRTTCPESPRHQRGPGKFRMCLSNPSC